ncbi:MULTISPECIES: hypothetical protein [Streptomyces violaceusniger group]|uniref:Uncharacterized protein n=2 Tax=Streptomyces javensis TaxID=114698 RepID=A0ABS0RG64_9ACTN|nr:hypothetical protein [Streptomyces javensis]MBI0316407.1 hypothetical protein [Streptomyces javensis]
MTVHIVSAAVLDPIGEHIVVILGTAVLPNLVLRVSASRTGRSARRSMSIASGPGAAFAVLLSAAGFAAAAVRRAHDRVKCGLRCRCHLRA